LRNGKKDPSALREEFKQIDKDNSNMLEFNEFSEALQKFDINNYKAEEIEAIFKHFDSENRGSISYE
jgi:Ca2+-binding EF-hand superfamily protein